MHIMDDINLKCKYIASRMISPVAQVVKNLPAMATDLGSASGLRRSPGEGNGNPLQYSCLENSMNRGVKTRLSD